jgi:hypothetical protein
MSQIDILIFEWLKDHPDLIPWLLSNGTNGNE